MVDAFYYIKIFDADDPGAITVVEISPKSSIELSWLGEENKIQNVIGSELRFSVFDVSGNDGTFDHFYTSNETRFKVQFTTSDTDGGPESIIWQGYIMPEQYREPWTLNNPQIEIICSDGLGRLKKRYFNDDFYESEHTVIEIIQQCLAVTSQGFDIYFSPAIINLNAGWESISLPGSSFVKDETRDDIYTILEKVIFDLQCCLFQEYGIWFIVGHNKRTVQNIEYIAYDSNGSLIGSRSVDRAPVDVSGNVFVTPVITVLTPYKSIEVVQPVSETKYDDGVSAENRDGWLVVAPLALNNNYYDPRSWIVNGRDITKFNPRVNFVNGKFELGFPQITFEDNRFIRLTRKIFVEKGQKLKSTIDFSITRAAGANPSTTDQDLFDSGVWKNIIQYEISIDDLAGNIAVYSNNADFDQNKRSENELEFIPEFNGYLDVKIYHPNCDPSSTNINNVIIENIKIQEEDESDELVFLNDINDEYSLVETIELNFGDDIRGNSTGFRLAPLGPKSMFLYYRYIDIFSVFSFNSVNYVSVDLRDLMAIKDFPTHVEARQTAGSGSWIPVEISNVIYNFNNGELMVFDYDPGTLGFTITTSSELRVGKYDYDYPAGSRSGWQQWVDDVFQVSQKRFGDAVGEIYRNLYRDPHNQLECTLRGFYGFSTLISFGYKGGKTFYPLNITWDIGTGRTIGYYSEAFYNGIVSDNIPPVVDAGVDQELTNDQTTANVNAVASDPDGFIATILWEVISGTATISNPGSLSTTIQNITSDELTLRITVTDNDGATATDEISFTRILSYEIQNTVLENDIQVDPENFTHLYIERLGFNPNIPATEILTLNHTIDMDKTDDPFGASTNITFTVTKNGNPIFTRSDPGIQSFVLSYQNGDVIDYELESDSQGGSGLGSTDGSVNLRINNVDFQSGNGEVTNTTYSIGINTSVSG